MSSISVSVCVDTDVDVDLDDVVEQLSDKERAALAAKLTGGQGVPFGAGDGDAARVENIIERAFLAAKRMPAMPPELAELFYVVHGRAMA